ncbi:MAG: BatD family protein [Lysobacter sp.]
MSRALIRTTLLLLLALASLAANAQTRAWLDRDRIALGETVTLNIETDASASPDYDPLQAQFQISGHSSSRRVELSNGQVSSRTLYAVALRPDSAGVLTVPALRVGNARTQPLSLVVTPASAVAPARAGDDVFIESEADDQDPYVQQAVGWVVRLYSAVPLVSGELDQPAPDGATLRQVGDDAQYTREISGRRYTVIERRYLLIPERSGELNLPGATFEGRGAAGFFDDFLGRSGTLQARAAPRALEVRPVPANAPQPWLPLHDLQLRYRSTPQDLRVGQAATLTIEAVADGTGAAQMPELGLPPIDGVQVFAEPVQADERFVDGRPRVTLTRKFSLVPTRGGEVSLPGLQLDWWDVRTGKARSSRLPSLKWQVEGGAADGSGPLPAVTAATDAAANSAATSPLQRAVQGPSRGWVLATLLFAGLWLLTLLWGLHRNSAAAPATVKRGAAATTNPTRRAGTPDLAAFKRALDTGDFGEVADALCALARPAATDLDEVRARLDDPVQHDAIDALQRARWGGGDGVAARGLLRRAFADGPRWQAGPKKAASPLPPLYPDA